MFIIHLILAIFIFVIQNFIGGKSYGVGYIRFALLDERDEAHSLNFVIKVFGPIIFLILFAALFQALNFKEANENIIRVIYIYLILRVSLIFLYERGSIVNWFQILFYYGTILLVAQLIYNRFLNSVTDLLPDFSDIKNEIWLVILIYLYEIGNGKHRESSTATEDFMPELKSRKKNYILRKYRVFNEKYGDKISNITNSNSSLRVAIISIMIIENFNRPIAIRTIEKIWCKLSGKEITQGIMQVKSRTPISDEQSVSIQTTYLNRKFVEYFTAESAGSLWARVIKRHSPNKPFIQQTLFICRIIIDSFDDKSEYESLMNAIVAEFWMYDFGGDD